MQTSSSEPPPPGQAAPLAPTLAPVTTTNEPQPTGLQPSERGGGLALYGVGNEPYFFPSVISPSGEAGFTDPATGVFIPGSQFPGFESVPGYEAGPNYIAATQLQTREEAGMSSGAIGIGTVTPIAGVKPSLPAELDTTITSTQQALIDRERSPQPGTTTADAAYHSYFGPPATA